MILEILYITGWITLGLIISDSLSKQTEQKLVNDYTKPKRNLIKLINPMLVKCHTKLEITNCVGETITAEVGEYWYIDTYIDDINGEFVRLIHEDDLGIDNPEIMFWLNKNDVENNF